MKKIKRKGLLSFLMVPRASWAVILGISSVVIILAAIMMEHMGLKASYRPLAFASTVIFFKFALFALWPQMIGTGEEPGTMLKGLFSNRDERELRLWDQAQVRLNQNLFATNVPTFVLNSEQNIFGYMACS